MQKKTLSSTEDTNFIEIARVENGVIKSQVRTTEYAVLEETFARRTFDESGDYTLQNPDFEVRELQYQETIEVYIQTVQQHRW